MTEHINPFALALKVLNDEHERQIIFYKTNRECLLMAPVGETRDHLEQLCNKYEQNILNMVAAIKKLEA